jgi:PASTA domain
MSLRAHDRAWRRCAALAAVLATAAIALVLPASGTAAVTIGATGNGGGYEFGGGPYVASIGQVIVAPTAITTLESFTLYPQGPPSFVFRAYVYAWEGNHTTGPALYESGDLHAVSESSFQPLLIETGGVPVTPGQQYVLFVSRSAEQSADESDTQDHAFEMSWEEPEPMERAGPYTEGPLVGYSNGYSPSAWGSGEWWTATWANAAFQATFDTPAPPSGPAETPKPSTPPVTPLSLATPASAAAPLCVVPSLGGLKLSAVKKALKAAGCSLGAVDHHFFGRPKGELMEQSFHQGTMLSVGTKVDVWLSRGAHQRHHKSGR